VSVAARWLLIAAGAGAAATALGAQAYGAAARRAEIRAVAAEARQLYAAFARFHDRGGAYPNSFAEPRFDLATAEPLRRRGYYRGSILTRLLDGRFDAYDAPDDRGVNHEFWLEMSLARDPSVRIVVARSDDAPLGRGRWLDGVYVLDGTELESF
jgi:hypothetical protein